jgi:hypothetical protein
MKIRTSKVEYSSYPNYEWIIDFDSDDMKDPKSELKTIEQAVRFSLETERYKYPIMGYNFGVTFDDLIGTDYSYIKSEIARRIRDALSIDDRIVSVDNFEFEKSDSDMLVKFNVTTILGDITVSTRVTR